MADDEDLKQLYDGQYDLVRADLSGAKFTGMDLRGRDFRDANLNATVFEKCNLSGCSLHGAKTPQAAFLDCDLTHVTFSGANSRIRFTRSDLRKARMAGLYRGCDFSNCDLRGTSFAGAHFNGGNVFDGAQTDQTTDFEGAKAMRALSRHPAFRYFDYARGVFRRSIDSVSDSSIQAEEADAPTSDDVIQNEAIAKNLARNTTTAHTMATALALSIQDQITHLTIPNEPDALNRYQDFVAILTAVRDGLGEIAECLANAGSDNTQFETAASRISRLQKQIGGWFDTHSETVAQYGVKTALLGAGSAFLTFCGAPALPAFVTLAYILEGKSVTEAVKEWRGKT